MKNIKIYTRVLFSLCLVALLLLTAVSCDKGDNIAPDTTAATEETTVSTCSHEAWEWVIDKNATCPEE